MSWPDEPIALPDEYHASIEDARVAGFLYLSGAQTPDNSKLAAEWHQLHAQGDEAWLLILRDEVALELLLRFPPNFEMLPPLYEHFSELLRAHSGNGTLTSEFLRIEAVSNGTLGEILDRIVHGLNKNRLLDPWVYYPRRADGVYEGLARCIDNEGLEDLLEPNEVVYVQEIPNLRGHCIILANGRYPIVGYHLDRFRFVFEYDDLTGLRKR